MAARAWLASHRPESADGDFAAARRWQRTLFDAGWLGIDWPADVGGRGLSMAHRLAFAEELVRSGAPQPVGSIGIDVVGPTIMRFGTPAQRTRYLRPILSGDEIWCQGFSEPGAGSDLASLTTRAALDGDSLVVTGQKVWTSWATVADRCALLVRTTPRDRTGRKHDGLSYLLVDMRLPGISVRPIRQMTGDEGFCEVFFDEVVVPRDALLGELGSGWSSALHTLSAERSLYVLRCRIEYETAFEDVIRSARETGRSEALVRAFALEIGQVASSLGALRAQTRATAERLVGGGEPAAEDSLDKLLLAQVEQLMFRNLTRILGSERSTVEGCAFGTPRRDIVRSYLYSRAASIYGGTSQIQRSIVANRMLGLPRS